MFSFLKKTKPKLPEQDTLYFKDNESAFQFALNTFSTVDDDSLVPEQQKRRGLFGRVIRAVLD